MKGNRGFFRYIEGSWHRLFMGLGCMLASSALRLADPLVLKTIIDDAIPSKNVPLMLSFAALYCGVVASGGVFTYFRTMIITRLGLVAVTRLKAEAFSHILSLPLAWLDKNPPGSLMARVESDGEKVKNLFSATMIEIAGNVIFFLGMVAVMFTLNRPFAIGVLICLPPLGILFSFVFNSYGEFWERIRKEYAGLQGKVTEFVQGIEVLKAFGLSGWAADEVDSTAMRVKTAQNATIGRDILVNGGTMFIMGPLFMAVVIKVLTPDIFSGTFTVGSLLVFLEYGRRMLDPIMAISDNYRTLRQSNIALRRIFSLLAEESEASGTVKARFEKEIEFKNVWFAYKDEDWVLRDVSFKIGKGRTVALTGPSGSGKTTCVSLLERFYSPQRGEITVDGIPLETLDLHSWRRELGLVLQDIYLFPGSVLENVRVYDDTIAESSVRDALAAVKADAFVGKLPDGIMTDLSERGGNLSQGERQLLSFARACAFDPAVIALDEATASVDPRTEAGIEEGTRDLLQDRTALIVAHRLSSVREADEILYFENGSITARGTHAELHGTSAAYRSLCDLQLSPGPEAIK